MVLQSRAPEHGSRRHHANAEVGACCIAPLLAAAKNGGITPPRGGGRGAADGGSAARVVGEEYLWAGDQLIQAAPIYADGTVAYDRATRWAYAPGAVTPLAQQRGDRLWYIVTDQV